MSDNPNIPGASRLANLKKAEQEKVAFLPASALDLETDQRSSPTQLARLVPELAVDENGAIPSGKFLITVTGLAVRPNTELSQDDWWGFGALFFGLDRVSPWIKGDWWLMGRLHNYPVEMFASQFNLEPHTLETYAWVASEFSQKDENSSRLENVSFAHHQVVAGMKDKSVRRGWLQKAFENKWSAAELKLQVRAIKSTGRPPGKMGMKTGAQKFGQKFQVFQKKNFPLLENSQDKKAAAKLLRQIAAELERG